MNLGPVLIGVINKPTKYYVDKQQNIMMANNKIFIVLFWTNKIFCCFVVQKQKFLLFCCVRTKYFVVLLFCCFAVLLFCCEGTKYFVVLLCNNKNFVVLLSFVGFVTFCSVLLFSSTPLFNTHPFTTNIVHSPFSRQIGA